MKTLLREEIWIQRPDPEMYELTFLDYLVFKNYLEIKVWIRPIGELV
jgi:hypothetical protein